MTQAKMETAAEKYRRIKAERLNKAEITKFTSPSGMEWELRRPDLQQFVLTGAMPLSLAEKVTKASEANGGDAGKAFLTLDWQDQARMIELTSTIVRHCAVSPKIVEHPTGPDEIGFDEVEMDDYNAIAQWAFSGGKAAEGLDTFRPE